MQNICHCQRDETGRTIIWFPVTVHSFNLVVNGLVFSQCPCIAGCQTWEYYSHFVCVSTLFSITLGHLFPQENDAQLCTCPYECFKQFPHEYNVPSFYSFPPFLLAGDARETAAGCCSWCFCPIYWPPPASLRQRGASSFYKNNISNAAHHSAGAGQIDLHSLSRFWNLCAWMNDCLAFFRAPRKKRSGPLPAL